MNYNIKKGSAKTMYLFIVTGSFLILAFSYNLYNYLQTNQLVYRTKESDSVHKINLSDIKSVQGKENKVILVIKESTKLEIDLSSIRSDKDKKTIRKALIDLV